MRREIDMIRILKTLIIFFFYIAIVQSQTPKPIKTTYNNIISAEDSSSGKISILNSSGNVLLEINDEANGGSINLPPLSTIGNSTNKLYNLGNMLYWEDLPVGQTIVDNGWKIHNGNIVLSDSNYSIGLGTKTPEQELHIENGNILVQGNTNWFPGLTIRNEIGRSVLRLNGTTSSSNYSSAQIVFEDLTTGNVWNLLHEDDNIFTLNSKGGTIYQSPIKVELGAPTNSFTVSKLGNIGIGTWSNDHKLAVAGSIIAEEIVVKLQTNWPDYVFDDEYELQDLNELENYVKINRHLEGIPSASEIQNGGINVSEIQIKLLEKIEELTLYIIKQDKNIKKLKTQIEDLKNTFGDL
jgi:hypothetical protein